MVGRRSDLAPDYLGNVIGTLASGAGSSKAQFSYGSFIGEMTGKGIYPYNAGHSISENTLTCIPCPALTHIPTRAFLPILTAGLFIRMRKDTGYSRMC